MWKATFTSLWSRKLRLFMSTLAIVLGVAFVSGSFVDTGRRRQDSHDRRCQGRPGHRHRDGNRPHRPRRQGHHQFRAAPVGLQLADDPGPRRPAGRPRRVGPRTAYRRRGGRRSANPRQIRPSCRRQGQSHHEPSWHRPGKARGHRHRRSEWVRRGQLCVLHDAPRPAALPQGPRRVHRCGHGRRTGRRPGDRRQGRPEGPAEGIPGQGRQGRRR